MDTTNAGLMMNAFQTVVSCYSYKKELHTVVLCTHMFIFEYFALSTAQVCRYRPIQEEFNSPNSSELQKYLTDEDFR